MIGSFVETPTDLRILALDIFAHHVKIDVGGIPIAKRRNDSLQQPRRVQVDVLLEVAPDGDQQPPQRHVIGNAGKSHGAEKYGVMAANLIDAVLGHHAPGARVVLAAPGKLVELKCDTESPARGLENANGLWHHLFSNTVAGDHGDAMLTHDYLPRLRKPRATRSPRRNGPELNPGGSHCHGGGC